MQVSDRKFTVTNEHELLFSQLERRPEILHSLKDIRHCVCFAIGPIVPKQYVNQGQSFVHPLRRGRKTAHLANPVTCESKSYKFAFSVAKSSIRCHSGNKSLIFVVQSSFLIVDGRGVLFCPLAKSLVYMINSMFQN